MKQWVLACTVACVTSFLAAIEFPKPGGDLANQNDWGGMDSSLLTSSYVDFIYGGQYSISSAFACRLFRVKKPIDVVLDATGMGENEKVTINQQDGDTSIFLLPIDESSITLKGGRWNAGGGTTAHLRLCSGIDKGQEGVQRTVCLQDGAVLENVANVYLSGGVSGNALAYNALNTLRLSGTGTKLKAVSLYGAWAYANGTVQSGNVVSICDGAEVELSDLCATDGKQSSVTSAALSGNVICVTNATLKLTRTSGRPLRVGNTPGSTGHQFILSGSNAKLDLSYTGEFDFFAADEGLTAGGNRVEIADGATLLLNSTIGLFNVAHGETVRVTGGATFGLSESAIAKNALFSIGRLDAASQNNMLIVEDAGSLQVSYLRVTCRENALVISNGTVTCHGTNNGMDDQACTIGYFWDGHSPAGGVTGNRLVLRGNRPALRAANGGVLFRYAGRCVFEVPADGYSADEPPIKAKTFDMRANCVLEAKLDDHLEDGRSGTYTLIETTEEIKLADGILAAANEAIEGDGRFWLSDDGKKLFLFARGGDGLTILIR